MDMAIFISARFQFESVDDLETTYLLLPEGSQTCTPLALYPSNDPNGFRNFNIDWNMSLL